MRKFMVVLIFLFLFLIIAIIPMDIRAKSVTNLNLSTASELIEAVNNLRASNGLNPYVPNPILMNLAQAQAEYNLSIGTITHISADGLRPYQRALLAGYAVAGDISQGGFFSENIVAGVGLTAEEAVKIWTSDAPHLNTMLAPNLRDIGAGVAFSGNTFYYVIDCGLSTGGTPAVFTPPPSFIPPHPSLIPNTPNADGSITYIVQHSDTLLGIAIAYNIPLNDLLSLNSLTMKSTIYVGQKIIIRTSNTPTPTIPTLSPTELPTITSWPTSTLTSAKGSPTSTSTSTPYSGMSFSSARNSLIIIIVAALAISGLLILFGVKRK